MRTVVRQSLGPACWHSWRGENVLRLLGRLSLGASSSVLRTQLIRKDVGHPIGLDTWLNHRGRHLPWMLVAELLGHHLRDSLAQLMDLPSSWAHWRSLSLCRSGTQTQ